MKKTYRKAMARVKACVSVGRKVQGDDFSPLEKTLYGMILHQIRHPDPLEQRRSSFTSNARSRLRLYPLKPKG